MYTTVESVRRRCSSVSSDDVPDSEINIYILEAQDEIDTRLQNEYDVPFTTIPTKIERMCADLAAYYVMTSYPDSVFHDDMERIYTQFKLATDMLTNGKLDLIGVDRITDSDSGTHVVFVTSNVSRHRNDRTVDYGEL